MQDQEQDRTEEATPFKLEESRQRGEVVRSMEVNTFGMALALLLTLLFWGAAAWKHLCRDGSQLLAVGSVDNPLSLVDLLTRDCLEIVLPFGIAGVLVALLANLAQTGPIFSMEPLQPRMSRIDPIKGLRRLFSKQILFELIKNVLKMGLLGGAAYLFFADNWQRLISQTLAGPMAGLAGFSQLGASLLERLAAALLAIAVLDLAFVRWQYRRQMMMSRRELREEIRRREGDPRVRGRQRELQRENRKQSRSLARVREADVLITNPDHVGIAIRYRRESMSAPHVLAKGAGLWVWKMKLLAWRHSVPVRENRPLARQLFRHSVIDRPIPPETYLEVARLYADLDAARRHREGRYEVRA